MTATLICIGLGFGTGIILALTGAGGTILAVPLLMLGLNLTVVEAAPIGLLAVSLAAGIGASIALIQGKVRYRAAGYLAIIGSIASPLGIMIAQHLPNVLLTALFAILLTSIAWHYFRMSSVKLPSPSEHFSVPCQLNDASGRLVWNAPCFRALTISGLTTGFLSGLLGVGGGFIINPALKKISNLSLQTILGTTLAVVALISMVGVISASLMSTIRWSIAIPFVSSAIVGMLFGRYLVNYLPESRSHQLFALLACIIAIGLLFQLIFRFI